MFKNFDFARKCGVIAAAGLIGMSISRAAPTQNPAGTLQMVATNLTVIEGAGRILVNITRVGGKTGVVSVDYATSDGTALAGADYVATSGTLYFSNNVSSRSIAVPIVNDALAEGAEWFKLTLSNPGGGVILGPRNEARVTIRDDDVAGKIGFSSATYSVNETNLVARIDVMRTGGKAGGVTAIFQTSPLSATDGEDYVGTNTMVTFGSNEMHQILNLRILNDLLAEGPEKLKLLLTSPGGGATLGSRSNAVLTIVDDEFPVEGAYVVRGAASVKSCTNTSENGTITLNGRIILSGQVGNDFSGTSLIISLAGSGYGEQVLAGKVDATGRISGTNTVTTSLGVVAAGTFAGKITGRNVQFSFNTTNAESGCIISGTFNGSSTPSYTNGFAPNQLLGATLTATNNPRDLALQLAFDPGHENYELTPILGQVSSANGPYLYYKSAPNSGYLLLAGGSGEDNNIVITLSFTSTSRGTFVAKSTGKGTPVSGTFVITFPQ